MKSRISVGSGLKIKRTATISDNAKAKKTLGQIKRAAMEGRLDDIFSLTTYDIIDLGREDGVKHAHDRHMTITELNQHIESIRQEKIDSIDFALTQMDLFSKYLKKNVHAANNGYSVSMVLNFMKLADIEQLVKIVLDTKKEVEEKGFTPGEYKNMRGQPESLIDRIAISIQNDHDSKLEDF